MVKEGSGIPGITTQRHHSGRKPKGEGRGLGCLPAVGIGVLAVAVVVVGGRHFIGGAGDSKVPTVECGHPLSAKLTKDHLVDGFKIELPDGQRAVFIGAVAHKAGKGLDTHNVSVTYSQPKPDDESATAYNIPNLSNVHTKSVDATSSVDVTGKLPAVTVGLHIEGSSDQLTITESCSVNFQAR